MVVCLMMMMTRGHHHQQCGKRRGSVAAMDDTLPPSFMCPISHDVMRDPCVTLVCVCVRARACLIRPGVLGFVRRARVAFL